jgi:Putative prokaryotic signal transducing protein
MATGQKPDPDAHLITVLRTSDAGLVAVAKSVLEDAGLDYFLRGEALHYVVGWGGFNSAVGDAEFQVREEDAREAALLLARLEVPIAPVPENDEE